MQPFFVFVCIYVVSVYVLFYPFSCLLAFVSYWECANTDSTLWTAIATVPGIFIPGTGAAAWLLGVRTAIADARDCAVANVDEL